MDKNDRVIRIHGRDIPESAFKNIHAALRNMRESGITPTDRYDALGIPHPDPNTMCQGQCEGSGTVPTYNPFPQPGKVFDPEDANEPWRSLWVAAEAEEHSEDGWHFVKCPDCDGTGISEAEKTMAPEGKVYQVIWADGRGVQYFDNLEAAEEFSKQPDRDAREPKLIDKPSRARVKSEAPKLKECNECLMRENVDPVLGHFYRIAEDRYEDIGLEKPDNLPGLARRARWSAVFEDRSAQVYGIDRTEAKIKAQARGIGKFVLGQEIAAGIFKAERTVLEAQVKPDSGRHPHPHGQDGAHEHEGLPAGGGHSHTAEEAGGHAHRPEDQMDGQHLNVGDGEHDHLLAKSLLDYIKWSVDAHHPAHKWLAGHKKTWIRHVRPGPPEKDFREANEEDWSEHTIWWMHSTGRSNPEAHAAVFLNPGTRIVEKEYEFDDGTRRPATAEDFEAEEKWFRENTPPELQKRLAESDVNHFAELDKEHFNPEGDDDVGLGEDWRLISAKFSTLRSGGKTEFKDEDEIIKLAARLVKEIVKRNKITFRPSAKKTTRELLLRSLERNIPEGIILEEGNARNLLAGRATMTLYPRENACFGTFMILVGGGRAMGFIRHKPDGRKIKVEEAGKLSSKTGLSQAQIDKRFPKSNTIVAYEVRDVIPYPQSRQVSGGPGPDHIEPNVKIVKESE